MPGNVATFSINLEGNAPAESEALASKLDQLRATIQGSTDKIGAMSKALRGLRGSSDEVVAAKNQLKAALAAERDKVSAATAEVAKHGVVLSNTAKIDAAAAKAANDFGKSLLGIEAGILKAGIVTLTTSVTALTVAFGHWLLETGDANRNQALLRESFAGTAENANHLGEQVDFLATKVPIAKDKLTEMATQLMRTRLSGEAIVDTLNVVGQASAAMGDEVGRALGDIVKRGQLSRRFQTSAQELMQAVGPQLQFKDIAGNLSKQLGIGLDDAKARLFEGRVSIEQGAAALRKTVEEKFGGINTRKLLSLDAISQTLHDRFIALTRGIDFDKILTPIAKLAEFFDTSTVRGAVLQSIITSIGDIFGKFLGGSVNSAGVLFDTLENGLLKSLIWAVKNKQAFTDWFNDAKLLGGAFVDVIGEIGREMKQLAGYVVKLGEGLGYVLDKLGLLSDTGGRALTPEEVDRKRHAALRASDTQARGEVITAPAHATGGLVMQPAPGEAFASVAPGELIIPRGASYAGAPGGGVGKADIKVTFEIHGSQGGQQADLPKQLSEPSFLATLTKTIEDACRSAGIETQAAGAP
jgi:hypothetical protein